MADRMFPLQISRPPTKPAPIAIPWSIAEKAYAAYAQEYGHSQSLERLADRGGFHWNEMDSLYPAWRGEVDELAQLRAETIRLGSEIVDLSAEVDRLRAQLALKTRLWREEVWRIHCAVQKRFVVGGEEDRRFLALALAGEVGEALNLIKKDWRGDGGDRRPALIEELADIAVYLELLARVYGVDLDKACRDVLEKIYREFPDAAPTS